MENCNELILQNIVRVELYPTSQCTISVPPQVVCSAFSEGVCKLGTPSLSVAFSYSENELELSELCTLKITNARQQAGNIYTHDLQIPISVGQESVKQAVDALQGYDFNAVYIFADGTKKISYTLPNASVCDIEHNYASSSTDTIKVKILSMSNLISLG